jgi:putative membrane protein
VHITKAYTEGWFHAKLALLIIMQILHALFARSRRQFEQDRNQKSAKFYRCINEAVTVAMIAIVILAVVKPF